MSDQEPRRSPRILRVIDNTALSNWRACKRRYYLSMIRNLKSKSAATKPALAYGTTWHAILEAHYKTGGDQEAVRKAAVMSWQDHGDPNDHRTFQRALAEYDNYCDRWGTHENEMIMQGKTVGWPSNPIVEQSTEIWWEGARHPYAGKIDRVFEHQGLYFVEDHKTTSAMGAGYFRQWDPSNQMMGYAWLAQLLTGLPIAGVRINAHAVLKTQSKFERQTITFSQDRLLEWATNYNREIEALETASEDLSLLGDVDDAYPPNWDSCHERYGACQYVDICSLPAAIRERALAMDFEEKPWDPMNPGGDDDA